MRVYQVQLTSDQISWLQYLMENLCDERGGYTKLEPEVQDLIDKIYNAKQI